jgi:pre-mRNA-splicing factor RBM22/SLT11
MLTNRFAPPATDSSGRKMLSSVAASSGLAPPADEAITSLYFTSIPSSHNTVDALTAFIAPLLPEASNPANDGAGLKSIVPVSATRCAFVNFRTRSDAEEVANKLAMRNIASGSASAAQVKISYGEEEVGVQWGRSRKPKVAATATATATVTTAASTTDAVGA